MNRSEGLKAFLITAYMWLCSYFVWRSSSTRVYLKSMDLSETIGWVCLDAYMSDDPVASVRHLYSVLSRYSEDLRSGYDPDMSAWKIFDKLSKASYITDRTENYLGLNPLSFHTAVEIAAHPLMALIVYTRSWGADDLRLQTRVHFEFTAAFVGRELKYLETGAFESRHPVSIRMILQPSIFSVHS